VKQNEVKTKVAIATRQFLCRLGIKTIISVIGVEPEFFEMNSFDNTKKSLLGNRGIDYMVIHDDILPQPKDIYLDEICKLCPHAKLMLIGNKLIGSCPLAIFVSNFANQKEMVEKFQEFFFESDHNHLDENRTLLSDREIEVLKTVAHGYSNKEIAEKLYISVNTVITHRKNITDKLGIKTIAGLTVYAIMNNIINPEDVKNK
jgi:DNA-binding CsgD family transcriptional regulator